MPARIKHLDTQSGTGAITVTPLGHAAGDYLVCTCESSGSTTAAGTPGTPTGFTKVFERTQGAGATGVTTLTIFVKLADGTETSIVVGTAGNHLFVELALVQGADPTIGNIVVGSGNGDASATATCLGITTPTDDCLVTWHLGTTEDSANTNFASYSNTNLVGATEIWDTSSAAGAGGGVAVVGSTKTTAGSTGDGTATHQAGALAWNAVYIAWPVKPVTTFPVEVPVNTLTFGTGDPCIIDLPPRVSGDTLLLVGRFNNPSGIASAPSGWTALVNTGVIGTELDDAQILIAWRKTDAAEGSTVSVDPGASTKFVATVLRIDNAADPTVSPPEVNSSATSGSTGTTAPNPGSLTPSGGSKDYRWYNIATGNGVPTMPPSPPSPSNYGMITAGVTTGGGAASNNWIAIASRELAASSEDPGAWTLDSAQTWTAWTIAIYPAVSGQYTDAATISLDLQASGTELAEYVEAATALVAIQASGTEIREIPDAAEVLVDLQASGTELLAKEYVESATALVVLQASGTEFQTFTYVDSATVLVGLQASGTDIYTPPEAGPTVFLQKPIIVGGSAFQDRSRW